MSNHHRSDKEEWPAFGGRRSVWWGGAGGVARDAGAGRSGPHDRRDAHEEHRAGRTQTARPLTRAHLATTTT